MSIRATIFSFDRAAQCDLLLRSLRENVGAEWPRWSVCVFYGSSNDTMAAGYRRLAELHPDVELVLERRDVSVQQQLLAMVDAAPSAELYTMMVDDDVIVRPISLDDQPFAVMRARADVFAVSLRAHPGVTRCQPMSIRTPPPRLSKDMTYDPRGPYPLGNNFLRRVWRYVRRTPYGDWYTTFSMDGNVYPRDKFRDHAAAMRPPRGVTQIERHLCEQLPSWGRRISCYREPRLINVAMNHVDKIYNHPSGDVSVEDLNTAFLAGRRMSYAHLKNGTWDACHIVLPPHWQDEEGAAAPHGDRAAPAPVGA
jgi:hypothetical protein